MRDINKLAAKYCKGGKVRYADGGIVETEMAPMMPEVTAVAEAEPMDSLSQLQMLMEQYGPGQSVYQSQLDEARQRVGAESQAFQDMLAKAVQNQEGEGLSKAEMYFRLAAAFGSPTKTGTFGETLSNVGGQMADFSVGKRTVNNQKLQLQIEAQKLRSGEAKEELQNLRALTSEEMRDRRALGQELIKSYVASGKPQSNAGKQAMDEGLKPNTPEYRARVKELSELDIQKQLASMQVGLGNLALNQAGLTIQNSKLELDKEKAARLSPSELDMKEETEAALAIAKRVKETLADSYKLNENSFGNSVMEIAQRKALELAGSKNEKLLNTRLLENMLSQQAVEGLKLAFGGNPTEGERKILLDLQGIGAKTKEERADIMKKAYKAAAEKEDRSAKKLKKIITGEYRTTTPGE